MKSWLQDNDIKSYSTQNERKHVVAERFARTLKSKICQYMTAKSKNVYIDKFGNVVSKRNNTDYITLKMKPTDIKSNTYYELVLKVMIKIRL